MEKLIVCFTLRFESSTTNSEALNLKDSFSTLTTVIFIVKSMTRVLFYFTFSDPRTVVLLGLF